MNKRFKARRAATFLAALGALVMSSGIALTATATSANAAVCVPQAASTETVNHPAVTRVVHHDAVTHVVHHNAVPSQWWNFSPNENQGPLEGEPSFDPPDTRGTWEGPHTVGGPSQDLTGTFQQGEGNGSWFHREAGQDAFDETVVDSAAYDETVVDHAAWTETIAHPAVTCDVVDSPKPLVDATVVVSPPKAHVKAKAKTHAQVQAAAVTPTVVHAGLLGTSAQDLRGEQGLALMSAGMLLLMAAGGLGLRARGAASRI